MRSLRMVALVGAACAVALAGCRTLAEPYAQGSLAHTPCNPNIVAGILNSGEPLTRHERAYLERCGIRFQFPPLARQLAAGG